MKSLLLHVVSWLLLMYHASMMVKGMGSLGSSDQLMNVQQFYPVLNATCPLQYAMIRPVALLHNSKGEIYISTSEGIIKKLDSDHAYITNVVGSGSTADFNYESTSDLMKANVFDARKMVFDPNDESILYMFVKKQVARVNFNDNTYRIYPTGMNANVGPGVFGSDGLLYFYATYNYCIKSLNVTTGEIATVAGVCGSSGNGISGNSFTTEKLGEITGIASFNSDIYLADKKYNCVRKLSMSDKLLISFAGTCSPSTPGDTNGIGANGKLANIQHATLYKDSFLIGGQSKVRLVNFTTSAVSTLFTTSNLVVDVSVNVKDEIYYLLDEDYSLYKYDGAQTSTVFLGKSAVFSKTPFPLDCLYCSSIDSMDVFRNGDLLLNCRPANAIMRVSLNNRTVTPLFLGGYDGISRIKLNIYNEDMVYFSNYKGLNKLQVSSGISTLMTSQATIPDTTAVDLSAKTFLKTTSIYINPYTNDMYFIEYTNSRVSKVVGNQIVPFILPITTPKAMAFAPDGRIFLFSDGTTKIELVSAEGQRTTYFSSASLSGIQKLFFYNDTLYFMKKTNGYVSRIYNNTIIPVDATTYGTTTNPCPSSATDLIVNGTYVYVLCDSLFRRFPIDGGNLETLLNGFAGTSFTMVNGSFLIANPNSNFVAHMSIGQSYDSFIGKENTNTFEPEGPISDVRLMSPFSIASDSNGAAYIVLGTNDYFIQVIKVENGISTLYTGQGEGLHYNVARVGGINTFELLPSGEIILVGNSIQKIQTNGLVKTIIGNKLGTYRKTITSPLTYPFKTTISSTSSMALDRSTGAMYFSTEGYQIQELFNNTFIGAVGIGSSGNTGTSAKTCKIAINSYGGLHFDVSRRELIFCDFGNNVVKMVDQYGNVSTIFGSSLVGPSYVVGKSNPLTIDIYQPTHLASNGDDMYFAPSTTDGTSKILRLKGCDEGGWTGLNCDIPMCYGVANVSSSVCSGHGTCSSPDTCICDDGYSGVNCELFTCFDIPSSGNFRVCSGKGECIGMDICVCEAGYLENDCSQFSCGSIDSRLNTVCSGNGECVNYNTCHCKQYYYGTNCENFNASAITCGGISFVDNSTCSGYGSCIATDTCVCRNGTGSLIRYGSNCELTKCIDNYYGNNCSVFCSAKSNCSSNGYCDIEGKCSCYSNETIGFYSGVSCSACETDYYGDVCLTKFLPSMSRLSDDGLEIYMKLFSPISYNLHTVNCSKLINPLSLQMFGSNISCYWNDKLNGNFSIKLGISKSVSVGSVIKINSNAFSTKQDSSPSYIETSIKDALNPIIPTAVISNIGEPILGICDGITIDGSKSSNIDQNQLVYEWTILEKPAGQSNSTISNSLLIFGSISPHGKYSVQLVVKSSLLNWMSLPTVFNFTKSSILVPQVVISSTTTTILTSKKLPLSIKKYEVWDNACGAIPDKSMLKYRWTQLEGGSINYTQLSSNDILINSYSDYSYQKYVFQVTVSYLNINNSAQVIIYKPEETFNLVLYQSAVNSDSVEVNVQIDGSADYVNSFSWSWSCKLKDGSDCEQIVLAQLAQQELSHSTRFKLANVSSPSIDLMLSVKNISSILSVTFPRQEIIPMVDVISVYPIKSFYAIDDILSTSFLVSVNGQSDGIESLIERNWTLNGVQINRYSTKNSFDLDLSTLPQGSTNVLALTVTALSSRKSSSKSITFSISSPPPVCVCTVSPSTGYALDTTFSISCAACVAPKQTLQFGFIDSTTGVKVPLMSTPSTISIPLPYTGTKTQTLYTTTTNVDTLAKTTYTFTVEILLPYAPTIPEVKKKNTAWKKIYSALANGDPKKLVFEYLTSITSAMYNVVYSSSRRSTCPSGRAKIDCSMPVSDWLEMTSENYNTTKMIFESFARDSNDLMNDQTLKLQTLAIYRATRVFDEINEDLCKLVWNQFKKHLDESLANQNLEFDSQLIDLLSTTLFSIKNSSEIIGGTTNSNFLSELTKVLNDLITLNSRNIRFGSSYSITIGSFDTTISKMYPSDLSNSLFTFSNLEGVQYPNMSTQYIQNVDLRKAIYHKIVKKYLNQDEIYNYKLVNGTSNITIVGIPYVLSSEITNQVMTIPKDRNVISYNFHYVKSSTPAKRSLSINTEIVCLSDASCILKELGNNFYSCLCSSASNVTIGEKRTVTLIPPDPVISNNTVNPQPNNNTNITNPVNSNNITNTTLPVTSNNITNPLPSYSNNNTTLPQPIVSTTIVPPISNSNNHLEYLAFISLIVIPIILVLIICVIVMVCKKSKGKSSPSNVEMQNV